MADSTSGSTSDSDQNHSVVYTRMTYSFQIINNHLKQLRYNQSRDNDVVVDALGNVCYKPDDIDDVDWQIVKSNNNQRVVPARICQALERLTQPIRINKTAVYKRMRKIKKYHKDLLQVSSFVETFTDEHVFKDVPKSLDELLGDVKDLTDSLTGALDDDGNIDDNGDDETDHSDVYDLTDLENPPPTPTSIAEAETPDKLTPLNRVILKLNNQGKSASQISRILPMYGMKLSKTQVWHRLTEIRNTYPNMLVRINSKSAGGIQRDKAKWYNIILKLKGAIAEYVDVWGFKPSIRTMQYQFIDEKIITDSEKGAFQLKLTRARLGHKDQNGKLFFPKLDINCFADDDSREIIDKYDGHIEPKETQQPGDIPDAIETINDLIAQVKKAPIDYEGKASEGEKGKRGGRWFGQPEYVEVWIEKNDLVEAVAYLLGDRNIKIRGNGGFASLDWLRQCAATLKKVINAGEIEPQNVHIIYCGDWDPSGEIMDDYMWRRLRLPEFDLPKTINLPKRLAIRPEQIDKYNFPLLNIEKAQNKKRPNPNLHEFKRKTRSDKATHLNAFFTKKHLESFKKLLLEEVDSHWYQEIYDTMIEVYEVDPKQPDELPDDEVKEERIKMYRQITKAFAPGWYGGLPDAPYYW